MLYKPYDFSGVMEHTYLLNLLNEELLLLPEKALVWIGKKTLIISDIHLGKASHFRKYGVAIPAHLHFDDLARISAIISKHEITRLIFLGDLFHSIYNDDWEIFRAWLMDFAFLDILLVQGNHDILPISFYLNSSIKVHHDFLIDGPFVFTHIPLKRDVKYDQFYNISGHIHPGIRLYGKGRQRVSLPCFYFASDQAIMPAFGVFTGRHTIEPDEGARIFAIVDNKIISI